MRASDLASFALPHKKYLKNNKKLKQEAQYLENKKISKEDWKKATLKITEFYLSQDITLTSSHNNKKGESIFHKTVEENLEKFLKEF